MRAGRPGPGTRAGGRQRPRSARQAVPCRSSSDVLSGAHAGSGRIGRSDCRPGVATRKPGRSGPGRPRPRKPPRRVAGSPPGPGGRFFVPSFHPSAPAFFGRPPAFTCRPPVATGRYLSSTGRHPWFTYRQPVRFVSQKGFSSNQPDHRVVLGPPRMICIPVGSPWCAWQRARPARRVARRRRNAERSPSVGTVVTFHLDAILGQVSDPGTVGGRTKPAGSQPPKQRRPREPSRTCAARTIGTPTRPPVRYVCIGCTRRPTRQRYTYCKRCRARLSANLPVDLDDHLSKREVKALRRRFPSIWDGSFASWARRAGHAAAL
jgi:hypothetical protein